jgi:hypothetical protein
MARVAILGGDSVVGRALQALLQGLGYDTRLIEEYGVGTPEELLEGTQLLLATPAVNLESRERFLEGMRSTPGTAAIPVLTLSTVRTKDLADQAGIVLWPCRLEDLNRAIEAARLSAVTLEEPADQVSQSVPQSLEGSGHPVESMSSEERDPCGPTSE